jgi:hypothetical protein
MDFSSLGRKWGREKGKEAKTILIFAGSLHHFKTVHSCALCLGTFIHCFFRDLRTGVRLKMVS